MLAPTKKCDILCKTKLSNDMIIVPKKCTYSRLRNTSDNFKQGTQQFRTQNCKLNKPH